MTVTPVCLVILSKELGFGLTAGGGLEAMRSMLILVTLLGSAFVAGRWGKVPSLGWSSMVLGLGMLVYSIAPTYGIVLLGLGLAGIGGGVIEGLINPLIQELHPENSGRYLNAINAFWSVGVLISVLVAGDLLTRGVSWRWIVGALGAVCIASGVLFFALKGGENENSRQNVSCVISHKWAIIRSPVFWLFFLKMLLAGAIEGGYTFWSATFLQIDLDSAPRVGGIATASFALGMIVARLFCAAYVTQASLPRMLLFSAASGAFLSLLVPQAQTPLQACFLLFAVGLSVSCLWPSIQSYAADRLPVDATALFILLSCAGIPGFALSSWLMGWIGEHHGLRFSLLSLSAGFVALFLVLVVERSVGRRQFRSA